ncbi:MAG: hypothetical protein HKN47_26630 [Pirellulaceae bacterium]|nr:hypothetical protein [Pirellulaceae bacterium]
MKTSSLAMWALFDQAVVSVTRFLIAIMIGKYGSESELGLYSVGFGLLIVITTGQESLLTTPYTFFVSRMKEARQRSYAANTLTATFMYLLLAMIVVLGAMLFTWLFRTQSNFLPILSVLLVITPVALLREFFRRWLFAHMRIPLAAGLDLVFSGALLTGLFALTRFSEVTAVNAFLVSAGASLVVVVVAAVQFRGDFETKKSRFGLDTYRNLRFGRWTAGASLLSACLMYFSHWYLALKHGESVAGLFAACMTIVLLANPFLLGISSFLAPRAAREFANHGKVGVRRLVGIFLVIVATVLALFSLVMFQIGDQLLGLLFNAGFQGHPMAIGILSLAMLGLGINYTVACGLRAIVLPQHDMYASVIGLGSTVILTLVVQPSETESMAICFAIGVWMMAAYRLAMFMHLVRPSAQAALAN